MSTVEIDHALFSNVDPPTMPDVSDILLKEWAAILITIWRLASHKL